MLTRQRALLSIAVVSGLTLSVVAALAHGSHDHRPRRQLLGIHGYDRQSKPDETWGTYCVTELAPFFREAVAINARRGLLQLAAATSTAAGDIPPATQQKVTVFAAKRFVTMDPG